jgi:hypothetical protein
LHPNGGCVFPNDSVPTATGNRASWVVASWMAMSFLGCGCFLCFAVLGVVQEVEKKEAAGKTTKAAVKAGAKK